MSKFGADMGMFGLMSAGFCPLASRGGILKGKTNLEGREFHLASRGSI